MFSVKVRGADDDDNYLDRAQRNTSFVSIELYLVLPCCSGDETKLGIVYLTYSKPKPCLFIVAR